MPIYAYRCEACGFTKDVLQKLSDAPLNECPSCGQQTFSKALTAPAFQLKGSGWYVTDFRDNAQGKKSGEPVAASPETAAGDKPAAESAKVDNAAGAVKADTPAAAKPAATATPAASGAGTSGGGSSSGGSGSSGASGS